MEKAKDIGGYDMKGKMIKSIQEYDGRPVWVEFGSENTVGCANDDDYALGGTEVQGYTSGIYRVEGHCLVSLTDAKQSFHEFTPRIFAIYEWQE